MEKDSQARVGRTNCDFCHSPSTQVIGRYLVCDAHVYRTNQEHVKEAKEASGTPLRAAPIVMSEQQG